MHAGKKVRRRSYSFKTTGSLLYPGIARELLEPAPRKHVTTFLIYGLRSCKFAFQFLSVLATMKFCQVCLFLGLILCLVIVSEAKPVRGGYIDYLEALRRMKQIPQWHCMRYRKFQLHGHCNRWMLMRRT